MNSSKDVSKDKKFKMYLRGDVTDACILPFDEYKKKTIEKWKRGENVRVEIEEI